MPILTVKNVTKTYDDKCAVNNVSFSLPKGKCIALIGPNGAGKSTILRMLTNYIKPTSGKITFNEKLVNDDPRSMIGYLPQQPSFYPWMTGKEFLIYCAKLSHFSKEMAIKRADELLQQVEIHKSKDEKIGKYSGGMVQRLGIAQAMIHQPKLLILDEPVSSLDPIGRRDVLTLLEQLKEKITIIFSTHILSDADEISDELLLLHHGKLVEYGSLESLRKKYQTTMIELQFDDHANNYLDQIKSLSTVTSCKISRNKLYVSVTNIKGAREQILQLVTNNKWPLSSYAINRTSLEDLFMKVVNHDAVENTVP